jgi:hypothetical protein
VANQGILSGVIGEGDIAALAAEDKAATATLDKGGSAAAIEKKDDLLPVCHRLGHSLG